LKAATHATLVIGAFYEWVDRVEKCGGTGCLSGIAECHAMIESIKKNRPRVNQLVVEPLQKALKEYAA
jgi:hypothetical protein